MSRCVLLAVARSGFHYLSDLVYGTGLFDMPFVEYQLNIPETFSYADFLSNLPPYAKITYNMFNKVLDDKTAHDLLAVYPDLKFIALRRRDVLAQAASFYLARQTGYFIIDNDYEYEKYGRLKIHVDVKELFNCYESILERQKVFQFLDGIDYLTVEYESLLTDTSKELSRIVAFLGKHCGDACLENAIAAVRVKMTSRAETPLLIDVLRNEINKRRLMFL